MQEIKKVAEELARYTIVFTVYMQYCNTSGCNNLLFNSYIATDRNEFHCLSVAKVEL